jgi:hypothetical protein
MVPAGTNNSTAMKAIQIKVFTTRLAIIVHLTACNDALRSARGNARREPWMVR